MAAYLPGVCVLYFLSLLPTISAHDLRTYIILGAVHGIVILGGLILVCILVPCCLCYKMCRKPHRQTVIKLWVQQPPAFPGQPQYQAVPGHPQGYGLQPMPSAPAYGDYDGPGHAPPPMIYNGTVFVEEQAGVYYPEPSHGDAQPPYNVSY